MENFCQGAFHWCQPTLAFIKVRSVPFSQEPADMRASNRFSLTGPTEAKQLFSTKIRLSQ